MSRSTAHSQLFINDGTGRNVNIQTGAFVTQALNMEERRRLNLTIGVLSATGSISGGGFTGVLLVQGTDEISAGSSPTGTPWAFQTNQPGTNGFTGALFWQTIPSGSIAITNAVTGNNSVMVEFTDVGPAYIRLAFNQSATGSTATGTLGGSGTMYIFQTSKHT